MLITYGPVSLNLISINGFERQAVYMGQNYCYTLFKLHIRAWLNPSTQLDSYNGDPRIGDGRPLIPPPISPVRQNPIGPPSVTKPSGPIVGPSFKSTVPPVTSDRALRHLLLTPRLPLQFSFLGGVSVQSPLPGFPCDCMGGPTPVQCHVSELTPKTWVVDWAVETAINETYFYKSTGQLPLILAQAWQMRHEVDEDFFCKRIVEGQTLFRLDALQAAGFTPDDFRSQLFIPNDGYFKRERIEVSTDAEKPNLLRFRVVDREVPFGWAEPNVSRLEARHIIHTTKGEHSAAREHYFDKIQKANMEATGNASVGMLANFDITKPFKSVLGMSDSTLSSVMSAHEAWAAQVRQDYAQMPVSVHTIDVICHGTLNATRAQMELFARKIVAARLSGFFVFATPFILANGQNNGKPNPPPGTIAAAAQAAAIPQILEAAQQTNSGIPLYQFTNTPLATSNLIGIVPFGIDTRIEHDLNGKAIHLTHSCITGPLSRVLSGAKAVVNFSPMPNMEDTIWTSPATKQQTTLIGFELGPPGPPQSNGTRGSWIENVMVSALQLPNSLPLDKAGQSRITKDSAINWAFDQPIASPPLPLTI